jgi:hypothetical protein
VFRLTFCNLGRDLPPTFRDLLQPTEAQKDWITTRHSAHDMSLKCGDQVLEVNASLAILNVRVIIRM